VAGAFEVRLTVTAAGREIAARTLTRQWTATGVTHRTLTLDADGAAGDLFLPPRGSVRRPGVLLLGGSEGGVRRKYDAALLASHGYPALALGYFGVPGLPATLHDIPLEYFVTAARLLRAQPGADPGGVVVNGYSRGSEAALLLAEYHPDLVRGAILYAPNDKVWPGFPDGGNAWTNGGVPVPRTAIPVTHVAGPVLAIAGGADRVWRSATQAQQIMRRLDDAHVTAAHQALVYPDAGHGVGSFPYLAAGTSPIDPVTHLARTLGGTRVVDREAERRGAHNQEEVKLSESSPEQLLDLRLHRRGPQVSEKFVGQWFDSHTWATAGASDVHVRPRFERLHAGPYQSGCDSSARQLPSAGVHHHLRRLVREPIES